MKLSRAMDMKLFAIAGNPVMHSRSPPMHNAAFEALGIDACYTRLAGFSAKSVLATAKAIDMQGLNITTPFKEEIVSKCDRVSNEAAVIRAVNTVILHKGKASGYNTDGAGVAGALRETGLRLRGARILVIGVGGAARAAAHRLLREGAQVTIANRTVEKAQETARELGAEFCALKPWQIETVLRQSDALVAAVPTPEQIIEPKMLHRGLIILDANYAHPSALVRDARRRRCRVLDGTSWLLHQGVEAFRLFTGRKAPIEIMRKALHQAKKNKRANIANTVNIALIGFMGSGKTTISRKMQKMAGMKRVGLDQEIERRAGMPIVDLFENEGEAVFRRMESRALRQALRQKRQIIDCGGGVVLRPENSLALKKNAIRVWVWADAATALRRVAREQTRPLMNIKDPRERERTAHRILQQRIPLYAENADLLIDSTDGKPGEIAKRLVHELGLEARGHE